VINTVLNVSIDIHTLRPRKPVDYLFIVDYLQMNERNNHRICQCYHVSWLCNYHVHQIYYDCLRVLLRRRELFAAGILRD
jgi:hypothetical protein